jgi:hypothetical protein
MMPVASPTRRRDAGVNLLTDSGIEKFLADWHNRQ